MSVKLLLAKAHVEGIRGFDVYRREGGYQSVEKALKQMNPESIVEEVGRLMADIASAWKEIKNEASGA